MFKVESSGARDVTHIKVSHLEKIRLICLSFTDS